MEYSSQPSASLIRTISVLRLSMVMCFGYILKTRARMPDGKPERRHPVCPPSQNALYGNHDRHAQVQVERAVPGRTTGDLWGRAPPTHRVTFAKGRGCFSEAEECPVGPPRRYP